MQTPSDNAESLTNSVIASSNQEVQVQLPGQQIATVQIGENAQIVRVTVDKLSIQGTDEFEQNVDITRPDVTTNPRRAILREQVDIALNQMHPNLISTRKKHQADEQANKVQRSHASMVKAGLIKEIA